MNIIPIQRETTRMSWLELQCVHTPCRREYLQRSPVGNRMSWTRAWRDPRPTHLEAPLPKVGSSFIVGFRFLCPRYFDR